MLTDLTFKEVSGMVITNMTQRGIQLTAYQPAWDIEVDGKALVDLTFKEVGGMVITNLTHTVTCLPT